MAQKLVFIHALTPLHAGTGQGVGAIDLPIQRERATNLPFLPGSSIRGCLRDSMADNKHLLALFGSERGVLEPLAGALRVGDAHLLLLPVRCLGATFAWVTSPFLLHRLTRSARAVGFANIPAVPTLQDGQTLLASMDSTVQVGGSPRLVLEDLDFTPATDPANWCDWIANLLFPDAKDPWRAEFKKRFAIIDDKNFDFLAEFATEVNAHVAINDSTGTVEDGALWYQEALPAESILCGILQADKPRSGDRNITAQSLLDEVKQTTSVQFGGKAGTGQGVARFIPVGAA